jgi:hypothetical protein
MWTQTPRHSSGLRSRRTAPVTGRSAILRKRAVLIAALLLIAVNLLVMSAAYYTGQTGWYQFTFRPPGTGATPSLPGGQNVIPAR